MVNLQHANFHVYITTESLDQISYLESTDSISISKYQIKIILSAIVTCRSGFSEQKRLFFLKISFNYTYNKSVFLASYMRFFPTGKVSS